MTRLQRFIITGFGLWTTCMSPQASEFSTSELGLRQPISQVAEQVEILLDSAWVYINQGNSRALHWVHQSLHLAREQGYFKGEAQALEMEGLYYELVENNMEEASIRYFEAVKICQEHQLDYLAEIYHIIGVMFHVNDHYEKAEEYYTLALEVMHPDMHQELQKKCFINLGSLHSVREDFDQAAYYFHKSLTIDSSPSFDFDTYANLGNLYIRKNQPELALPYMEKATEIHPENVDSERNLRFLIDAKTRLKDTSGMGGIIDRAKSWLEKETKLREKSLMLRYLSDYFKEMGQFEKALEYKDQYLISYEEILENRNNELVLDLENRYQSEQAKATIAEQQLQLEKEAARRKGYLITGLFLLLLCVVIAVFLRSIWVHRERLKKEVFFKEEALNENDLLLQEMHHRIKNNLQLLNSILNLHSRNIKNPLARQALESSRDSVSSIGLLHHQLYKSKDFRKINFKTYTEELCDYFRKAFSLEERNIQLNARCEDFEIDINKSIPLGLVMNEIVTNAIKHAFNDVPSGEIQLTVKTEDGQIILEVRDNGIGILPANTKSEGTGEKLIHILSNRFKAQFECTNQHPGTLCRFKIPA